MSEGQTAQTGEEVTFESASASEPADFAKFGALVYGVVAAGMFLTTGLSATLGDDGAAYFSGTEEAFYRAAATSLNSAIAPLALLAVGLALYYHLNDEISEASHKPAAIAAAAGSAVAIVGLLLLVSVFEPSGLPAARSISLGDELLGAVGAVVGLAVTAAIAGFGLDNLE
ncbi:hypothetical protein [Halovivax limisalsi]|uniref:hypothetical protein n=1 Tax=Halovivax limisalsi TaxID=1453760 RepID=UPI001FFD5BAF|nr:hypothetical protein [Halovivax limisalsi]